MLIEKAIIAKALKEVAKSPVNDHMLKMYLKHLCDGDQLVTSEYPVTESIAQRGSFLSKDNIAGLYASGPLSIVFTTGVAAEVQAKFPAEGMLLYPNASHWIFLEDDRHKLAKDVLDFIKETDAHKDYVSREQEAA